MCFRTVSKASLSACFVCCAHYPALKLKAAGRAAELSPAVEATRLVLWNQLHVTLIHRQRATAGGGSRGAQYDDKKANVKDFSSLQRTGSLASYTEGEGDSDYDGDEGEREDKCGEGGGSLGGGGGVCDRVHYGKVVRGGSGGGGGGRTAHVTAVAASAAAILDATPPDVALAAVVYEVCVLEAVQGVLAPAVALNARRCCIAAARAELPARTRDVTAFFAAKMSRAKDPKVRHGLWVKGVGCRPHPATVRLWAGHHKP